jgi:trimeric autotransporter adhesin
MSRIRDITKFLGLTAAANPTNLPLASTGDALDSAEALALITGGNAITVTSGVVNHDDTSSQASVNNSGSNFIQDITLDTYGHVTAITSAEASGGGGLGDYGVVNSTGAAATASGTDAIAIGEGATSIALDGIAIGRGVANNNNYGVAIGNSNGGNYGVTIGNDHTYNSGNNYSVSIGYRVDNPGQSSVAIGNQAGYLNQYASENSIFQGSEAGYQSGANYLGIFIGSSAGRRANYNNSSTYDNRGNIAIGYYAFGSAGSSSAGSQYTVAIGYEAGRNIHNSTDNIAIGRRAMGFSSSASNQLSLGHDNIAIGNSAGTYLYAASIDNTLIGKNAGINLGNGQSAKTSWNTYIGSQAGFGSTTAEGNTFIGWSAGYTSTTGSYNGILGYNSNLANGANTGSFVIGYQLTGKGSNTTFIHGAAYMQNNQSSWYTTSDERIKTNVTDYTLGLDTLGQVNVKTYNYLSDSDIATLHPELADSDGLVHEGLNTEKTVVGIMAQELEAVLPNSVETRDNGMKSVNKDELFWVMLNSIKELKARVEALENA